MRVYYNVIFYLYDICVLENVYAVYGLVEYEMMSDDWVSRFVLFG